MVTMENNGSIAQLMHVFFCLIIGFLHIYYTYIAGFRSWKLLQQVVNTDAI